MTTSLPTAVAQAAARAYIKEATRADRRKHPRWALEKSASMWAEYAPLLAALDVAYRAGAAAAIEQARADEREQCARRLEVAYGYRCPECGGKAGFTAANSGRVWSGCGGGHTWTPPSAPLDVHKAAAIARAGTSGGDRG